MNMIQSNKEWKNVQIIHCASIKLHSLVTEGDGSKTRWYGENFLAASVDGVDAQGVRSKWYATQWSHSIHSKKAIQAEKSNEINISMSPFNSAVFVICHLDKGQIMSECF